MIKRFLISAIAILCCVCAMLTLSSCNEKQGDDADKTDAGIFYVEYGKAKIELGKDAKTALSALGEAKSVKELGDCAGIGAQVKYTYDNFEIYTVKSADSEVIDEISFTSDIVKTPKGICLGDDEAAVVDAYGTPTSKSEKSIIYTQGKSSLIFGLDNGYVKSIDYKYQIKSAD